jgi:HSP20 family molecular chaperone IbpA
MRTRRIWRYGDHTSKDTSSKGFTVPESSSSKKFWSLNTELDNMLHRSTIDDIVETSVSSILANAIDSMSWGYPPSSNDINWGYPPNSNHNQGESNNNSNTKKNDLQNDPSALKDIVDKYKELSRQHRDLKDTRGFYPRVNVIKKDSNMLIEAAIPGYVKEDISIEVKNGFLILRGSASSNEECNPSHTYICREIKRSKFQRSFMLPDNLELSAIEASFSNGILEISIPYKKIDENNKNVSNIKIR